MEIDRDAPPSEQLQHSLELAQRALEQSRADSTQEAVQRTRLSRRVDLLSHLLLMTSSP